MKTPLGNINIICDDEHLLGIEFGDDVRPSTNSGRTEALQKQIEKQLEEYFARKRKVFDVPISFEKLSGTEFQKRAWKEMLNIPYGETISYGTQAKRMKHDKASRAVGSANGKNPIPIIIPCHRVISSDNSLGGYSSGLWRKEKLLALESSESCGCGCSKSG